MCLPLVYHSPPSIPFLALSQTICFVDLKLQGGLQPNPYKECSKISDATKKKTAANMSMWCFSATLQNKSAVLLSACRWDIFTITRCIRVCVFFCSNGQLSTEPSASVCNMDNHYSCMVTWIQVGHRKGSYFLHPQQTGWFKDGELLERMNKGQRFDLSIRHVTPNTSYRLMELLVPGASFVTIMRRPLDRFLSLFNFRKRYKIQYKVLYLAARMCSAFFLYYMLVCLCDCAY